jgi:hypothetical protein
MRLRRLLVETLEDRRRHLGSLCPKNNPENISKIPRQPAGFLARF